MVKVDATEEENKALAEEFDVKGFPTMKVCHHSRLAFAINCMVVTAEIPTEIATKHS